VFGGQQVGFYVDVGAYDPVDGSVTKLFYDRGWSGINVEPGSVFERLAADRPRDVNLRMAVLDRKGEAAFTEDPADRGMSRISERAGGFNVPCDTLEGIVAEHGRERPVDFIKIDAEGAEGAIVNATDWRRLRPRVLLIEATLPWSTTLANSGWEPTLLNSGYVRAFFDGINCYYVPEEEWPVLSRHFQAPVNVLDGVVPHSTIRAITEAREETARMEAERANAASALQAVAVRLDESTAAMRDLRSRLEEAETALAVERAGQARLVQELAEAVRERDAAVGARDAALREREEALQTRGQAALLETPPAQADAAGLHTLLRRVAWFAYRLVRPVVRPVAWRVRSFMLGPTLGEVVAVRDTARSIEARIHAMEVATPAPAGTGAVQITPEPGVGTSAAELKRLAQAMEDALMTLAVNNGETRSQAPSGSQQPEPRLRSVTLRLPAGRLADIAVSTTDLSVGAALVAAEGEWEPHVRRYLEATIRPEWTCLDIGANVGVHTLSLAVLAHAGRVVAFEADPANYTILTGNIARLHPPKADVEALNLAVWDESGHLTIGGADELAGCSFVAAGAMDAAMTEERLREVVSADAIAGTALRTRQARIEAVRLDDWASARHLARLDFIKLDVEGAEAHVVRGAHDVIRRLRPVLLVEYNPACAEAYFGQAADALFLELSQRFARICAIEIDGTLSPLPDWPALRERLARGKGWEDLVCLP
jgi:FkbM family methyltransferase